jgi:hypothetical protein
MSDQTGIPAFIAGFVDSVNRGRMAEALAAFAPDATIVEDIAPFRWHGPSAAAEWLAAMGRNAHRVSAQVIEPTFLPSRQTSQTGQSSSLSARATACASLLARMSLRLTISPPAFASLFTR